MSWQTTVQSTFQNLSYSFLNRATFGRCCLSIWTVALLLYAISIIRSEHPDVWTSSARLALSRIASGWNNHVVRTVVAVFPYLCLERKSLYLLSTEGRLDVLLRHPNRCNREQFEASGHRWESGQKISSSIWMMFDRWASGRNTTSSRRIQGTWTSLSWILHSLLEAQNWSVDFEYNNIPE
jgi:hypothetical protein